LLPLAVAGEGVYTWIDPDVEVGKLVAEFLYHGRLIAQSSDGIKVCDVEGGKCMQA
jgi:hypothetical protein